MSAAPAPTALIDFADPHEPTAPRLRHAFGVPRAVWMAQGVADVRPVLAAVQAAAAQGAWCVGYVRYEAANAFDSALQTHPADGPLAWFAVYDQPLPWPAELAPSAAAPVLHWDVGTDGQGRADFDAALVPIHSAIAAGQYYQVNYTAPLRGQVQGGVQPAAGPALFAALQRAQTGGYAAYIDTAQAEAAHGLPASSGEQLLSVSPELFFDWHSADSQLLTRPMKGTAPRGATPSEDAAQAAQLRTDPKERAENVMVVDLLRNDVSRIAQPHSVQVPVLFHVQALPTVWQMTSDVVARTQAGVGLEAVFAALFPCGSVTGAPKVQAMQAIAALEPEPRGVYCGALGVVRPGQLPGTVRATFNVPIRTVVLRGAQVRCGIGSGITSGASADAEWREWQHKRRFLERASMPFELLETLALDNGQLRHIAEHLARLQASANHFATPWDVVRVQHCLEALLQNHPEGVWRVRLLLAANGEPRAEAFVLELSPQVVSLQLATAPLQEAHSEFVRHKTTRRGHYDAFAPTQSGVFDTLLWNEAGEITECTRGNIAMYWQGRWVTPSLACGLLPGVARAVALREGRLSEAVVRLEDVPQVEGWAFLNSLRGWIKARLV